MPVRPPIASLTGLRFVAAICVVVPHGLLQLVPFPAEQPAWYTTLTQASAIGMSLFFVLSGFVIHYNYSSAIREGKLRGLLGFFVARFARLYPLYILCVVFSLAATWWHGNLRQWGGALPYYLLMMQSWVYGVIGDNNLIYQYGLMIPVTWSISTEWFFYAAYPAVCFLILRLGGLLAKLLAAGALCLIEFLGLYWTFANYQAINQFGVENFGPVADIASHWQDSFIRWLVYFSPYSRIGEFVIGCFAAAISMQLQDRRVTPGEARFGSALLLAALAGMAVLYRLMFGPPYSAPPFTFVTYLHLSFGFAPLVGVVIFCCARYRSWLSSALSVPLIVQCGEVSYGVYLLHPLVFRAFVPRASPITDGAAEALDLALLAVAVVATIAASFASYGLWERPMRRLIRGAFGSGLRRAAA
jgi:peptidoglycan/LPS O-acetylase OafA/YrhL